MKLFITTTVPEGPHSYFPRDAERLKRLLDGDRQDGSRLVSDPDAADLVLFVGSVDRALADVRASEIFRQSPTKCFVVHGGDEPLPTLPGIYSSVPKRWYDHRVHRAGFYLRTVLDDSICSAFDGEPHYLFSFVGAGANHPVRQAILNLHSPEGFLLDSCLDPVSAGEARERFVLSLRESLFVLCPRGGGTSSFRIFETMMAGRVPVIISDQWVEPEGPDWSRFSMRVAERDVPRLPGLLAERRAEGRTMGANARLAWEQWFSPQTAASTLLGWIHEIHRGVQDMQGYRLPAPLAFYAALEAARPMKALVHRMLTRSRSI